jgi:hypothetical protein
MASVVVKLQKTTTKGLYRLLNTAIENKQAHLERMIREELESRDEPVFLTRYICTNCSAVYHSDEDKATVCNECLLKKVEIL